MLHNLCQDVGAQGTDASRNLTYEKNVRIWDSRQE